jgi:hypothetical protein
MGWELYLVRRFYHEFITHIERMSIMGIIVKAK